VREAILGRRVAVGWRPRGGGNCQSRPEFRFFVGDFGGLIRTAADRISESLFSSRFCPNSTINFGDLVYGC
jgi:hypothetical protein